MRSPSPLIRIGDEIRRVAELGRRAQDAWREVTILHAEGVRARTRALRAREAGRTGLAISCRASHRSGHRSAARSGRGSDEEAPWTLGRIFLYTVLRS